MFAGFESQERSIETEYKHNATPLSSITSERTYKTSPGSTKRRRLSNDYYDESQQQRDRYQSDNGRRSPMTATYGFDSAIASPISRQESLRSAPDSKAFSGHGSPYIPVPGREQSILSIPERRAPPFHSPISEPSCTIHRPNLPNLTTPDRSYDRSYSQTPGGRYGDYPSRNEYPRNDYPRSEYALETSRSYHQHKYTTSHDTSYASSQSDYGYQQPRNQSHSGPPSYQLNQGQTPFTNGHHPGNYNSAAYPAQDMGDSKPRKRRGNLPKPTTDILTNWFINHLEHPYPNEEEKQLLMSSTGLQLSK